MLAAEAGIKYELTAMGTIIEGDLDQLLELTGRMHRAAFSDGVTRVLTTIKIDDRHDKPSTMKGKTASVRNKL